LTQGLYEPRELVIASEEDFHVAFHDEAQLSWLANTSLKKPLHAWIKTNTGMGRLGFSIEAAEKAYDVLTSHKNILKPVRILSHFACADNIYHPLNQQQINTFRAFIQDKSTEYSLCNSAGLLNFPTEAFDFVRPGILTYGISPLPNQTAASLGFKPVMTVHSTLMAVNQLKKGDTIGYDARFQCEENMPVGIIAFGYGDGYPPTALDNAPILVNGTRCQLIGKVSMDMIAVDLRLAPSAKMGDIVTLWGEDAPVEELTKHTYQNVWHIVTSVQNRVKFTWKD
jgi:alanine racemase